MKKSINLIFILFLSFSILAEAGSVHLINDSPFTLRAVIRGNDGSYLGEVVLNAQHTSTWLDSYGQAGHFGYKEAPNYSIVPYTVLWYCLDGSAFSVCTYVSPGGTVSAQSCPGNRMCRPKKRPKYPLHNQPEEFLHQQHESPSHSETPETESQE